MFLKVDDSFMLSEVIHIQRFGSTSTVKTNVAAVRFREI
jgi:hypothetical protein